MMSSECGQGRGKYGCQEKYDGETSKTQATWSSTGIDFFGTGDVVTFGSHYYQSLLATFANG
jgi:hypothetical protein